MNGGGGAGGPGRAEPGREPAAAGELVHHWFNGLWGRLSRRDVYIRTAGAGFELELRQGGAEGKPWRRTFPSLDAAVDEAQRHMAPDQRWTDLIAAHRRSAASRPRRTPSGPAAP